MCNRGALIIRIGVPLKGSLNGFYKGSMIGFYSRGLNVVGPRFKDGLPRQP